ncbi:hypothetical protein LEMLEM_LOCUS19975, partial [Lemmus lemmus]
MDQDPLKGCHEHPLKLLHPTKSRKSLERTTPIFPNIVYKC